MGGSSDDAGGTGPTRRLGRRPGEVVELPSGTIRVLSGRDAGREVTVTARPLRIGKDPRSDLPLTDDAVSRSHAVIAPGPEGYTIEDLGSTNGTLVDGVSVKLALLRPGSRIRVGETDLAFVAATRKLLSVPAADDGLEGLVGHSPRMREIYAMIRLVAPTDATVVLRGETGTGKELAARAIHQLSMRRGGPMVVFDGANVDRELIGSALFGHERGAFTGAVAERRGAFEAADGGTLFLDEVGDLPGEVQGRLLGVLQRREVVRLGSTQPRSVDVRVVAATHRDLDEMVRRGEFREDLYYRLVVVVLEMPPLRDRREDLPLLAAHLLSRVTPAGRPEPALAREAMAVLERHPFRGNVRELANCLERAVVLSTGGEVQARHLALAPAPPAGPVVAPAPPLADVERATIQAALDRCGWNKARAARELGIGLTTIKRKVQEFGLVPGPGVAPRGAGRG